MLLDFIHIYWFPNIEFYILILEMITVDISMWNNRSVKSLKQSL